MALRAQGGPMAPCSQRSSDNGGMKLIILDRDGTLNALPEGEEFVASHEAWLPLPGALEAVARINRLGWHVVIATNQPGLGRGLFDVASLNDIHAKLHRLLAAAGGRIDAIFYCPHAPGENCHCRKPAPGLLEQICERYGVDPKDVHAVGDSAQHLQAAATLGMQLHALRGGDAGRSSALPDGATPSSPAPCPAACTVHQDLSAFADYLARQEALLQESTVVVSAA